MDSVSAPVLVLLLAAAAASQAVPVPNASFEDGQAAPQGWTLSGGKGQWLTDGAAHGRRAIAVTGTGNDHNYWRSGPLPLEPSAVYRLTFRARSLGASGGTPVSGPIFCNRDLGSIPAEWKPYESVCVAPANLKPDDAWLRFGQWEVKGTVAFDDVDLVRAMPVYVRQGDLVLGEGERLDGHAYVFDAPLRSGSRNHSRPLASYTGGFNSDRWVLAADQNVTYRHAVAGRRQTAAAVNVSVTWYAAGELAVLVSADGNKWTEVGRIGKAGGGTYPVPAGLLPRGEVWVRLAARPGGDGKPPSLQVGGYSYTATLDGEPATLTGRTQFLALTQTDPRLKVEIDSLGDGLPGGDNRVVGRVVNTTDKPIAVLPTVTVDGRPQPASQTVSLQPGASPLNMLYALPGTGDHRLTISCAAPEPPGGGVVVEASLHVPDLHSTSYGERLAGGGGAADLWWASSGWKISRVRPAPADEGKAVRIRAARNEAEAAQLVVRPKQALRGLTATAGPLAGPGGATMAAGAVEVLRVRYVPVTQPTDASGCVADWPDPLPPLVAPLDLEAGRNQPLWVRVTVPRDAKPGTYTGTIRLAAGDWSAQVPLEVEVFDFALPDRMTCQTAFGFSPENVWRYQNLKTETDRRTVLEKYLANLSRHHIAPYHPAPLDPIQVTWPKGADGKHTFVPQFDWAAWDQAMARAIDQYHFNSFMVSVPGMGGGTFHQRHDPELHGFKEDTPEYKTAFTNYGRALEAHLKEKGWLPYAFIYWFDEPDPKDYAFVTNGFRKLKETCPGITRMLTEQVEPQLVGGPNLWCPISDAYDHAAAEARRKQGERFWWYVCCGPKAPYTGLFIDHPATELRVWLWQTWQRRIDGILIWSINYWTSDTAYTDPQRPQNPYEDPMGWVSGYGVPKGARQAWGNGDGRFIYPPEAAADGRPAGAVLDGPVDSIRWEMLRDGVEDYEYLAILRRCLAEKGGGLDAARRAEFAALLDVPDDITKDLTTFTRDPAPIERRRATVAKAIETLLRR